MIAILLARSTAEWEGLDRNPAPRTEISGAKWILDATPIERNALMRRPYADRPEECGRLNFPVDTIRAMLAEALSGRQQLMLHVFGDSTLRIVFGLMHLLAPAPHGSPLQPRQTRVILRKRRAEPSAAAEPSARPKDLRTISGAPAGRMRGVDPAD